MPKVECSIVIDQPIEKVFTYTTTPSNYINWQPWILDSQAERRISTGTRIEVISQFMGRKLDMTTQVVEYVPSKRLVAQGVPGSFFKHLVYRFEPEGESTKVTYIVEYQPRGLLQMLGPLTVSRFQREVEDSLRNLKGVLEADY